MLTLDQVLAAKRTAECEQWTLHFNADGSITAISRKSCMVPGAQTWGDVLVATLPPDGWRHAEDCDCEFCAGDSARPADAL